MNFSTVTKTFVRKYFVVGLIVVLPFAITLWILNFVVGYFDGILAINNGHFLYVIPERFHPNHQVGFHIKGLGLIFTLFFIVAVGFLSSSYIGHHLLRLIDIAVGRVPFARNIYRIVKLALKTYAARGNDKFARVVLIEYPRNGLYTLAFVTGPCPEKVKGQTKKRLINLFVPTTPNPTSGFLIMIPEEDAIDVHLSVEDAFKLIVSGGVVNPEDPTFAPYVKNQPT